MGEVLELFHLSVRLIKIKLAFYVTQNAQMASTAMDLTAINTAQIYQGGLTRGFFAD